MMDLPKNLLAHSDEDILESIKYSKTCRLPRQDVIIDLALFDRVGSETVSLTRVLADQSRRNQTSRLLSAVESLDADGTGLHPAAILEMISREREIDQTVNWIKREIVHQFHNSPAAARYRTSPGLSIHIRPDSLLGALRAFSKSIGGPIGLNQWMAHAQEEQKILRRLSNLVAEFFAVHQAKIIPLSVALKSRLCEMVTNHAEEFFPIEDAAHRLGENENDPASYIFATNPVYWSGVTVAAITGRLTDTFDITAMPPHETIDKEIAKFCSACIDDIENDIDENHHEDASADIRDLDELSVILREFAEASLQTPEHPNPEPNFDAAVAQLADRLQDWNEKQTIVSYYRLSTTLIVSDETTRTQLAASLRAKIDATIEQLTANARLEAPVDWAKTISELEKQGIVLDGIDQYYARPITGRIHWSTRNGREWNGPYLTLEKLLPDISAFLKSAEPQAAAS